MSEIAEKEKSSAKDTRCRHWCFTLNEPSEGDWNAVRGLQKQARHWSWQLETAPDTGKAHIQGYVGFEKQMHFSTLKGWLPRSHLEMARDPVAAYNYCCKDATCADPASRCKSIEPPKGQTSGLKSTMWEQYKAFAAENDWKACLSAFTPLRVHIGAMRSIYEDKLVMDRTLEKQCICFWGPPGTGKSLTVTTLLEGKEYFRAFSGKWFDGYAYEPNLWIDDMQPKSFNRSFLLQLCDRGVVQAEIKGGTVRLVASTIYITSNYHPSTWVDRSDAMLRRLQIYHVREGKVEKEDSSWIGSTGGNTIPPVALSNQRTLIQMLTSTADAKPKQSDMPQQPATPVTEPASVEADHSDEPPWVSTAPQAAAKFARFQPGYETPHTFNDVDEASIDATRLLSQRIHDDVERRGDLGGPSSDDEPDGQGRRPAGHAGASSGQPAGPPLPSGGGSRDPGDAILSHVVRSKRGLFSERLKKREPEKPAAKKSQHGGLTSSKPTLKRTHSVYNLGAVQVPAEDEDD